MPNFLRRITVCLNIATACGVAIFFVADRLLKTLALSLPAGRTIPLIGDIFSFRFTANYHIAFSLPLGGRWLTLGIALLIAGLLVRLIDAWPTASRQEKLALIFIILGAASNLADRLLYGFVIDYLSLRFFTVFNLADAMISAGIISLLVAYGRKR